MSASFQIGDTLGDYRIVGVLGKGGMGHVFKVEHGITKRVEALKVLLRDQAAEPQLAQRFLREIQLQASLQHPNIAAVYNAFTAGGDLVMVMELVEGDSLDRLLERACLPVETATSYARQALAALAYAHGRGITHRDIKPANMIVTPEGILKLTDFGLAKARTDAPRLTRSGALMGSVYYMPPEQVRGSAEVDARSDIYSLGVVLYELVTGARPFDPEAAFDVMRAHVEQPPVPPIQKQPALPPALSDAILTALAKKPEDRFQSADQFREALARVDPVAPPPPRPASHLTFSAVRISLGAAALVLAAISVTPSHHISMKARAPVAERPATKPATPAPSSTAPSRPASVTLIEGTTLKVRTSGPLSTTLNTAGEAFTATLEEPLTAAKQVVTPKGAIVEGRILDLEKGGRLKGRASLTVQLTRLHTAAGAVRIVTDSIRAEGGGPRMILFTHGAPAVLARQTPLTFRLQRPATVLLSAARAAATPPPSPPRSP